MFPDGKWLDALKLPTKIKLAIAVACGVVLGLLKQKVLSFGDWDSFIAAALITAVVVFAVLVIVETVAWLAHPLIEWRRNSVMASRRAVRRKEEDALRKVRQSAVLKQLDHLSRWELIVIADALESNSPTFYTYVHAPPLGALQAKNLIWASGGQHNQDHYPFTIADFVWDELQNRRDEFLEKGLAARAAEDEGKRLGQRRV